MWHDLKPTLATDEVWILPTKTNHTPCWRAATRLLSRPVASSLLFGVQVHAALVSGVSLAALLEEPAPVAAQTKLLEEPAPVAARAKRGWRYTAERWALAEGIGSGC